MQSHEDGESKLVKEKEVCEWFYLQNIIGSVALTQALTFLFQVLTGHTGSVLCLQYDERVIISGSSDSTVRVWDVKTGDMTNTLIHHCEAVLHLRFNNGMMVTCSKVCWCMIVDHYLTSHIFFQIIALQ